MLHKMGYGIVGVAAVAAIAVPIAAVGSSGGPSPAKSTASAATSTAPAAKSPAPAASAKAGAVRFEVLARSAGISVAQLQNGLVAAKRAGGNTSAGIAALARAAGVSGATAQRVVRTVFGARPENPGMAIGSAAAALAHGLGI